MNRFPNSFVLLFYLLLLFALATYLVPAGTYERQIDPETGVTYVIPDSYSRQVNTPVSFFDVFKAIPAGMMNAGNIIVFVLITGGSFGIIQATGTINRTISSVARRFSNREKALIPIIMFVFSLAGAIFGFAEEVLPLYIFFISLAITVGFDTITGTAMILVGTGAGFAAGFLNPFTTGIAQNISELPLFSGLALRLICYVLLLGSAIAYVYWYASRISTGKTKKFIANMDFNPSLNEMPTLDSKHKRVFLAIIVFMVFMLYAVLRLDFHIIEISTTFLVTGIVCGVLAGFNPSQIANEFNKGATNLLSAALIIGLSRAIMMIMIYGNILDTIIFYLASAIQVFPPIISANLMFFAQSIINIFIASGSGQATVTMPIMANIADISGFTRQTAVLALQFGDGFTNVISPTSGYFMAALAISGIPWSKWFKWMLPLFIIWVIIGCILMTVAVLMNYGPF
ncbi:MAG: YfcC family protein [Firmicutes bacterium]|nr:YfcC family protein [Bacillota bacterium]